MKGDLLYLKSTECKCGSRLKNIFTATPRRVFDGTTGGQSLAKLTHEINHHTRIRLKNVRWREVRPRTIKQGPMGHDHT